MRLGAELSQIIDGKLVSEAIKSRIKQDVEAFQKQTGVKPCLATVLVGEDPASRVYIRNKIKSTEQCGMTSIHRQLDAAVTEKDLLKLISELNQDNSVHGILVQLPLPKHINEDAVLVAIDPKKDVDGFHPHNVGLLVAGKAVLQPCTPYGVMKLLEHYQISTESKHVVIIGRSNIVGKPQAMMMLHKHATVTIAHSKTKNLPELVRQADIVVAAVGRANMVQGSWIKSGAVVIDVGINRLEDGSLCGDVDFQSASKQTSFITPVPGGVGPMTIAMLMNNTLQAARLQVKD